MKDYSRAMVKTVSFDPARADGVHIGQTETLLEAQRNGQVIGDFRKRTSAYEQLNQISHSKRDLGKNETSELGREVVSLLSAWDRSE